jgi:hypothetical protein
VTVPSSKILAHTAAEHIHKWLIGDALSMGFSGKKNMEKLTVNHSFCHDWRHNTCMSKTTFVDFEKEDTRCRHYKRLKSVLLAQHSILCQLKSKVVALLVPFLPHFCMIFRYSMLN